MSFLLSIRSNYSKKALDIHSGFAYLCFAALFHQRHTKNERRAEEKFIMKFSSAL